MSKTITGTFAATGQSAITDPVTVGTIALTSAGGEGTVAVEGLLSNNVWAVLETLTVDGPVTRMYEGMARSLRLNCLAHSANMAYVIEGQ